MKTTTRRYRGGAAISSLALEEWSDDVEGEGIVADNLVARKRLRYARPANATRNVSNDFRAVEVEH
jgi:hypothetical protein